MRLPTGLTKNTVVAEGGIAYLLCQTDHGACHYEWASDFLSLTYYDIDGNETDGIDCDAESAEYGVRSVCCERLCILVPDALLATPAGTPLFVDNYPGVVDGVEAPDVPDVALAGDVFIGVVAPVCEGPGVSYWDNLDGSSIAPEGYGWIEVDFASSVVQAAAAV